MQKPNPAQYAERKDSAPEPTPQDTASQIQTELSANPETAKGQGEPVILVGTEPEAQKPLAPAAPSASATGAAQVLPIHVEPNLLDLIELPTETRAEEKSNKEQRDLNEVVHTVLIVGVAISTALMLIGLALDIVLSREMPTTLPDVSEVFTRVFALRPSGFFALGILALIATPIVRVIGSVFAFAYERDWRFVGITMVVLIVVLISILVGSG